MLTLTLVLLFVACGYILRRELQLRHLLRVVNTALDQSQRSTQLATQATKLLQERTAAFEQLQTEQHEPAAIHTTVLAHKWVN